MRRQVMSGVEWLGGSDGLVRLSAGGHRRGSRRWAILCCMWGACGIALFCGGQVFGQQSEAAAGVSHGARLYRVHCAACHGENGDGQGIAAAFLHPRPRNLRLGPYKLVSTSNNVPMKDDLALVLQRGMPGSSMPSWAHLSEADRAALIDEVIRLRGAGARDAYIAILREDEELSDEELKAPEIAAEIDEYVASCTVPGDTTVVPEFPPESADRVAHGKEVYAKFSCISCHGTTGKGDGVEKMFDDDKRPTAPRDFTLGIFKGGDDTASLYRRIAYGMPGTPMPSSSAMTAEEMTDLVYYIRSLSTEEQRQASLLRRARLSVAATRQLPVKPEDSAWDRITAVRIPMTPLWWRNEADPRLEVRSVHNGKEIAVHLRWRDATQNLSAFQPEQFEDMVAVQWAVAGDEPFLGMGGPDQAVDLWLWRASSVEQAAADQQMDDYILDSPEYRRLQSGKEIPDFVTARGLQNPLAIKRDGGFQLSALGPGSTTFRPPMVREIPVAASWRDGQWNVVFRRDLALPKDQGMSLQRGKDLAIAFAIWNGEFRDRASQKVISIWNDLRLE